MRSISIFVCYFAVACWSPEVPEVPEVRPRAAAGTASPGKAVPATTGRPEISITSVTSGNPVVVEGFARTFENDVVLRLRDATGELMHETFATSIGEIGHHNPFRAEIFVTRDPGGRLTAEALEYSARDGSERSVTSKSVAYDVEPVIALLHLPKTNPTDCSRVHPIQRSMPKSLSMARLLVEALLREPALPFPKGATVQGITLRNGIVTVDFDERLRRVGGSCAAQAIRAAVERTLVALPSVDRVVITTNGSRTLALQP